MLLLKLIIDLKNLIVSNTIKTQINLDFEFLLYVYMYIY